MKKKILVTGGAGFIGSCLIKYWLRQDPGIHIINADKLTYCGDLSRLKSVERDTRYRFVKADVTDRATMEKLLKDCEGVVHLAAETHVDRSLLEAKDFFQSNIYGTYTLLEAARSRKIKKFLYISTDEVYGSRAKGFFRENDRMNPSSPYAISKTAADFLSLSYAMSHHLHTVVTRGSNTYGPYQYPEKVVPLFVSNALCDQPLPLYGDGKQVRNWLHAEDHASGIVRAYEKGKAGEAYNIATPDYQTNKELTLAILNILGKDKSLIKNVTDRIGHDRRYATSSKKLRALGWTPKYFFKSAFKDTVEWYRDNQDWWQAIKAKSKDFKSYYEKAYKGRQ